MNYEPSEKKSLARKWVNGYTVIGTGIVVTAIIPGTTSTALAAMEAHMCYKIGKIYRGDDYTMEEAVAVARMVGFVAVAAPMAVLEAMNALPIAGWLVKGTMAGGIIKALGEAIITRYEKMENKEAGSAIIDVPTTLDKALTPPPVPPVQKDLADSQTTFTARLRRLDDLHREGILTTIEHATKRSQVLSEL